MVLIEFASTSVANVSENTSVACFKLQKFSFAYRFSVFCTKYFIFTFLFSFNWIISTVLIFGKLFWLDLHSRQWLTSTNLFRKHASNYKSSVLPPGVQFFATKYFVFAFQFSFNNFISIKRVMLWTFTTIRTAISANYRYSVHTIGNTIISAHRWMKSIHGGGIFRQTKKHFFFQFSYQPPAS